MIQRQVVLVTGKTGSGKSTYFRESLRGSARLIIWDTLSEYCALRPAYPAARITELSALISYLQRVYSKSFRVVFDPVDPEQLINTPTGPAPLFEIFCKMVYDCLNNVTLGVEEIANYVRPGYCPEYLRKIVRFGRHSGLSLWMTTQRPAEVPPLVRAQLTRFVSFRQHEPRDIDWIRQVIGDEAFTLRDLPQFKPREFDL